MLPMGAKVMTYECGIRFLTDYLEGDHYFKIDREEHNLDRCRTQFKLVGRYGTEMGYYADDREKISEIKNRGFYNGGKAMSETKGRVTIPTDLDVIPETLKMLDEWGADAIRDCDGTEFPAELKKTGAKIYATYYTTRKDNAWAKAHPEEIQQMYIMTSFTRQCRILWKSI